jgi:glutamate/tyrosine decarboxylase-like PLP-dependent enzyme
MDAAERTAAEFSWPTAEVRRVGYRVVDLIAEYLERLPARPAFAPVPSDIADALLGAAIPEHGQSVDAILADFVERMAPWPFGNGHPRFYGWVNSPPAVVSIMADALGTTMNPSVAGGNHAAVWVERQVLGWFKSMFGFPRDSMGLLVSGGSAAAITALACARYSACQRKGWDVRAQGVQRDTAEPGCRLLVYKTAESHSCHQKAIELLGIGSENIRVVPSDDALRMRPSILEAMLAEDIALGHVPVAVIASAGTVNTGAIDPIDDIAEICARHAVWLHIDAAYGGAAILSKEYNEPLKAIERADSVAFDPHKWMYVPVDAGLVLIRNGELMRAAFSLVPPYLRTDDNLHGVNGPPWFSEYGSEQTRPFRALKVWAAPSYFGTAGYRQLIEHDIEMAKHLARRVRDADGFMLWEPTSLSIVCFRAAPQELRHDDTANDALNRRVLEDVQLSGTGFLSGTVLNGRFWLRACIVNPLATGEDVNAVFDAVRAALRQHMGPAGPGLTGRETKN